MAATNSPTIKEHQSKMIGFCNKNVHSCLSDEDLYEACFPRLLLLSVLHTPDPTLLLNAQEYLRTSDIVVPETMNDEGKTRFAKIRKLVKKQYDKKSQDGESGEEGEGEESGEESGGEEGAGEEVEEGMATTTTMTRLA